MSAAAPNILVVEDEGSIASFVSLYLKNAGYVVRTASNGLDALAQVGQEMPGLIVLDLMLPDIDGIEICRRIRRSSDVPILMLTARSGILRSCQPRFRRCWLSRTRARSRPLSRSI